jgi:hypothetical protein
MPEITAVRTIDNLHHVRAAIVGPAGKAELHHLEALDAILEDRGELHYIGAIGTRRTRCETLDGLRVFDGVEIHPAGVLPDAIRRELRDAYAAEVVPVMAEVAWLESLYALPDNRIHIDA